MFPEVLRDGRVRVIARAEGDGAVGDAVWYVSPGDPRYEELVLEAAKVREEQDELARKMGA